MKVLDLFSGIGGFALGLQRAGFTTQYFCEIDPYCRRVLAKHWPSVPCFEDVRTLHGSDLGPIDLICGGFPCQDISLAGKGAGLSGSRSGLWSEYARLIGEVRPKYVLIENVAALRSRGLDEVLRSLFEIGYDAEWHCIPASAIGAPHRRDRVWIVAYPASKQDRRLQSIGFQPHIGTGSKSTDVADTNRQPSEQASESTITKQAERDARLGFTGHGWAPVPRSDWWAIEPAVGRVADGISDRVHRLKQLGNSIVPQIAEFIGNSLMGHNL